MEMIHSIRVLGIETSCDETAAAVVENGKILSNIISSQIDLHSIYGGIVPEIAARQHLKLIDSVIHQACVSANVVAKALDAVAVTSGPGLPSALLVGVAAARGLAFRLGKPLMPVHHLEAHLYSPQLPLEPFVGLVVSGGHTLLSYIPQWGKHYLLGRTLDDAAGEAFDKAAQLLGLSYPGGPAIEAMACNGNPQAFDLPRPMIHSADWNFSFSGLKTAVRRTISKLGKLTQQQISDLSSSFQTAVTDVLVEKTIRAAKAHQVKYIAVSGGVACNKTLQETFKQRCNLEKLSCIVADRILCTDNAAMIALFAEKKLQHGFNSPSSWDIEPDWNLEEWS